VINYGRVVIRGGYRSDDSDDDSDDSDDCD
jgi:hypothetical protein